MFDLAITNAVLVGRETLGPFNIYIDGETISAVCPFGEHHQARETYDADGRHVLPGLVDAHVHFRDPGPVHKEGFENGSIAAACGGVTTVLVMPTDDPMTADPEEFRRKILLGHRSHVDFGLQAIVGRDRSHVAQLADDGACAFELFFADVPDRFRLDTASQLLSALRAIAAAGGLAGVTPTDNSIVQSLTDQLVRDGRTAPLDFAQSRPPAAEAIGIALACEAAILSGCRIHIRQVSCREAVAVIASYKQRAPGLISAETLPHNLFLTEDHLLKFGPLAKMAPPLRAADHGSELVRAVRTGVIDMVATDHAPHLLEEKEAWRQNIWNVPSGIPGLETFLPVMLARCLDGAFDLPRLVDAMSTRPAKVFGLFPKKGCIAPGSDADLLVIDTSVRRPIMPAAMRTRAKYSPFRDEVGAGSIDLVLLRGRTIAECGEPFDDPGGCFVRPLRRDGQP